MKRKNHILTGAALMSAIVFLNSCTSEDPFGYQAVGEGTISVQTQMYSDVEFSTRALDDATKDKLFDDLLVYIENDKGVIRRYQGKNDIPNRITLPVGKYAIEGWTGDSVSASFTEKFYRGYQPFEVISGVNTPVTFNVNIANVIVSVDASDILDEFPEVSVSFWHSRKSLEFDKDKVSEKAKGYFMMPNADKDLYYKVVVKDHEGNEVIREKKIEGVQRAHEYQLQLIVDEPVNDKGGALVKIQVIDIPILDQKFEIFPAPSFKGILGQENINLEDQIVATEDPFQDFKLRVLAYGGMTNLSLEFDSQIDGSSSINDVNLRDRNQNSAAVAALENIGITYYSPQDSTISNYGGKNNTIDISQVLFTFEGEKFFKNLPEKDDEYIIKVKAVDGRSNVNYQSIRIARSEKAIENNLISSSQAPATNDSNNPMAVLSTSIELTATLNTNEASEYGFEYRKLNSSEEFKRVKAPGSRSDEKTFTVKLTGLEPGTTYEYRAFCDDFSEKQTKTFKTEDKYIIPNSNMNDWSTCSDVTQNTLIPNANGIRSFWDTGNHGSMSLGALGGTNITTNDDTFIPGNTVAKLKSQFVGVAGVVGRLAAGNLFVGEFIKTEGTSGAQLKFGREYNGSHPSALKVKVNYRPGKVDYSSIDDLKKDATDQAQIYIALASSQVELNTANGIYFDENADNILAYGQITWDSDVAGDNQLEEVKIEFKYKDKAKSNAAKYLVIVCSASKFGDYFTGSSKSVMYLDDFELEYGELQFEN
ncbi:MAG: PCMD domain-containing protein [Muribaculaceae bacterium]|nr:PCMD domain-containing protein [Muribaculaceae bacterium]